MSSNNVLDPLIREVYKSHGGDFDAITHNPELKAIIRAVAIAAYTQGVTAGHEAAKAIEEVKLRKANPHHDVDKLLGMLKLRLDLSSALMQAGARKILIEEKEVWGLPSLRRAYSLLVASGVPPKEFGPKAVE